MFFLLEVTCSVFKLTNGIWKGSVQVTLSRVIFEKGGDFPEPQAQVTYDTVDVLLLDTVILEIVQVHRGVHHRHRHV